MIKHLLILLLTIQTCIQECDDGCLRCEAEFGRCQLCDITRKLKTVHGRCLKVDIPHCKLNDMLGNCLYCEKGFTLDEFSNWCMESVKTGKKFGCDLWDGEINCRECEKGLGLNIQNECFKIETEISNCFMYKAEGVCEVCKQGFSLSIGMDKCEKNPTLSNCGGFSKLRCMSCREGYQYNINNYLYELFSFQNLKNVERIQRKFLLDNGNSPADVYSVCQPLRLPNCQIHSSFDKCVKCQANFYLYQDRCHSYPKDRIYNCASYSDLQTCVACSPNFYLKSSKECVEVESIPNCSSYSTKAAETVCSRCVEGFYLSESNTCVRRTSLSDDITNCKFLFYNQEKCEICNEQYILTTDMRSCLPEITFCKDYEESNSQSQQHICKQCINQYFFNEESKKCMEGTIKNCLVFNSNSNVCSICENRYYLSGGTCRTHEDLVYCGQYSNTKKNTCESCNNKTLKFERANTCLPVNLIQFCNSYDTIDTCFMCKDGYQLTPDKRCSQIPGREFCLQKNNQGKCVKCLPNKILQDGSCHNPLRTTTFHCADQNVDGLIPFNQLKCSICRQNSIPFDYKNHYICYENNYITSELQIIPVDNCLKYKKVQGQYMCQSCDNGFFLTVQGTCSSDCGEYTKLYQSIVSQDSQGDGTIDAFLIGNRNVCGPKIEKCELGAPLLQQNLVNVNYGCIQCKKDGYDIVKIDSHTILQKPILFKNDQIKFSPLSFTPARTCLKNETSVVLGQTENVLVNNTNIPKVKFCELYNEILGYGLGCMKCEHGYTGKIVNVIDQCVSYSTLNDCQECELGFYLQNSKRCEPITPVKYCRDYGRKLVNECVECQKDFFLENGMCKKRNRMVKYCDKYVISSDDCEKCKLNYTIWGPQGARVCEKVNRFCKKDQYVADSNGKPQCTDCIEKHYLKDNFCHVGGVEDCLIYDNEKIDICKICKENYYLHKNKCLKQDAEDKNCKTFNELKGGVCQQCNQSFMLFSYNKSCKQVIDIPYCTLYDSYQTCIQCQENYQPANYGQKCKKIPVNKFCKKFGEYQPVKDTKRQSHDEDNCVECYPGYLLRDGKCKMWLQSFKQFCSQESEQGYLDNGKNAFFTCQYCKTGNYVPVNQQTVGVCLETNMLDELNNVNHHSITNCAIQELNGNGAMKCKLCKDGYYILNRGNSVIDTCITKEECYLIGDSYSADQIISLTNSNLTVVSGPKCHNSLGNNQVSGLIVGLDLLINTATNTDAIDCPEDNWKIQQNGFDNFSIDIFDQRSPVDFRPLAKCESALKSTSIIRGKSNSMRLIPKCNYYVKQTIDSKDYIFCQACKKGWTGNVVSEELGVNPNNQTVSYIESCDVEITGCKKESIYSRSLFTSFTQFKTWNTNFNSADASNFNLDHYFSACDECTSADEVLVAYITLGADAWDATNIFRLKNYDFLNQDSTVGSEVKDNVTLACRPRTNYKFRKSNGTTIDEQTFAPIDNCHKVVVNVFSNDVTKSVSIATSTNTVAGTICVQCKPGYRPKYAATHAAQKIQIGECEAIPNCDLTQTQTWPGMCQQCEANYYFSADDVSSTTGVDYTTCIKHNNSNPRPNCFAIGSNGKKCEVCKPGFQLVDYNCLEIKTPMCADSKFAPNESMSHKQYILEHVKYHGIQGCNQCQEVNGVKMVNLQDYYSFIKTNIDTNFSSLDYVCMEKVEAVTQSISNCETNSDSTQKVKKHITDQDGNGPILKCVKCIDLPNDSTKQYIIDTSGKCQKKEFLQNCKIAQPESSDPNNNSQNSSGDNSTYCDTCASDYFNVAGKCIAKALYAKCMTLDNSQYKNFAQCLKCRNYYYLVKSIKQLSNGNTEINTECFPYYSLSEQDTFVDFLPDKTIKNCIQFGGEPDRLYCIECEDNHVLLILSGDEKNGEKGFNRYCMNVNQGKQNQCKKFDTFQESVGVLKCTECETGYFLEETLPPSSDNSHQLQNGCIPIQKTSNCEEYKLDTKVNQKYQAITYEFNYMPRLSTLKCLKCTEDYFLNQGDNVCQERSLKNSDAYQTFCQEFQTTLDECKLCKPGYFLSGDRKSCKGSPLLDTTKLLGSIQSCKLLEECERHQRLEGLSTPVETVLSCHVCKRVNEIPFIALAAGEHGQTEFRKLRGIRQFEIKKPNSNPINTSTFCIEPTASNFNIESSKWEDLPLNCGVGAINTDILENERNSSHQRGNSGESNPPAFSLDNVATFCVACKPGFRAVQRQGPEGHKHIITQCEKIANCQESHAFNFCTKCELGFSFRYQNGTVQYDQCVAVQNNNECFSWDVENSKCEFCCKGHYLNRDGICERINPPACKRGEYSPKISFSLLNLNTGLHLNSTGTGCNKCDDGFAGVYLEQISLTCTESPYHIKGLQVNTNYKTNCLNYRWEDEALLCAKCSEGFVPDESNGDCIPIAKIRNCILARDEDFCVRCDENTVLVNGQCQDKSIQNCIEYTYEQDSNSVICKECAPNYYREANQCKLGIVKNCEIFETKTICNVCKLGFQLVQRKSGISYCYPIDENLNCGQFQQEGFQKGQLKCVQCITNNYVISTLRNNFYDTHCMKFFEVANCVNYHINPVVADSGFYCKQCTDNFFVKDGECEVRTLVLPSCLEYEVGEDKCKKCKEGYYLDLEGITCTAYPIGTMQCRNYRKVQNKIQCLGCKSNFYLEFDRCKELKTEDVIENCLYHLAPQVCESCINNHIIVDSECKAVIAQNCKTIENLNACLTCPEGFGFVEANGVKSCQTQSPANCARFNPEPPYACLQCNQNYYVVDGACVEIVQEKRIAHCLVNKNETECSHCSAITALSIDLKKCVNTRVVSESLDHNCQWSVVEETASCNSCKPGYVFNNDGECVRCQVDKQERCYQCDPLNLKKCILCNPGFYHNMNGGCSHVDDKDVVGIKSEADISG